MNKDVKRAIAEQKALRRKATRGGRPVNSKDIVRYQRAEGMASKLFYQSVNVED